MKHRMLHGITAVSTGVLCSLAVVATARAELVSYDFTASVSLVDTGEMSAAGLWVGEKQTISGSFSYDSSRGWWGTSSSVADPSLRLKLDNLPQANPIFALAESKGPTLGMQSLGRVGRVYYEASLMLTGLAPSHNKLPTSLTLGTGSLKLYLNMDSRGPDLVASLTTLTRSGGGTFIPELNPASGAGAMVLLLGGLGVVLGRHRRS